jgi:hypothetical protein
VLEAGHKAEGREGRRQRAEAEARWSAAEPSGAAGPGRRRGWRWRCRRMNRRGRREQREQRLSVRHRLRAQATLDEYEYE